jgi:hypothetical protein
LLLNRHSKVEQVREKSRALKVVLTHGNLLELEVAASNITIQGARYPEQHVDQPAVEK